MTPSTTVRRLGPALLLATSLAGVPLQAQTSASALHFAVDTLYRVDLTFETSPVPVATFDLPPGDAYALTAEADGTLWALFGPTDDAQPDLLIELDPATGVATPVGPLDIELVALEVGPDGRLLAIAPAAVLSGPPTLYEVDRTTGTLTPLFNLPPRSGALMSDGVSLFTNRPSDEGGCTLLAVDLVAEDATEIPTDPFTCPSAAAAGTDGLWMAAFFGGGTGFAVGRAWSVDPASGTVDDVGSWVYDFHDDAYLIDDLAAVVAGSGPTALDVPTLDGTGLATMVLLLAVAGLVATRRRKRRV